MSTKPISVDAFESRLNTLRQKLWEFQIRVAELEAFDREWGRVFEAMKAKSGADCRVNILGMSTYRVYRWDRPQALVVDLLSLLDNEEQEESIIRQTIFHLRCGTVDSYLNPERTVTFLPDPNHEDHEDEETKQVRFQKIIAQLTRQEIEENLKKLFPKIGPDLEIKASDLAGLRSRIKVLAEDVRAARQVYAHKNQPKIVSKYAEEMESLTLRRVKEIIDELFEISKLCSSVFRQSTPAPAYVAPTAEIRDHIDLILFGTFENAQAKFRKVAPDAQYHWTARERFFESDEVLTLVANPPTKTLAQPQTGAARNQPPLAKSESTPQS